MDQIDIRYTVPEDLMKRVLAMPVQPRQFGTEVGKGLSFFLGVLLMCFGLNQFFFNGGVYLPILLGFVAGAIMILLLWRSQSRGIQSAYLDFNDTCEEVRFKASPSGVFSAQPGIESKISWSLVSAIATVKGGVVLEFPASRLIIPDTAIPNGDKDTFVAQLNAWNDA